MGGYGRFRGEWVNKRKVQDFSQGVGLWVSCGLSGFRKRALFLGHLDLRTVSLRVTVQ